MFYLHSTHCFTLSIKHSPKFINALSERLDFGVVCLNSPSYPMFAGCLQIIPAHSHLIRAEGGGYSQIIRAENTDVCRSCELCLQAATDML
jgi:hypothetical protein